jgi:hypothetical protein
VGAAVGLGMSKQSVSGSVTGAPPLRSGVPDSHAWISQEIS